jgi:hypothetical protein
MKTEKQLIQEWEDKINAQLKGKTIAHVQYLTDEEISDLSWSKRGFVIVFTDGSYIYPTSDDEANNAGSMRTSFEELPIIPVINQYYS